MSSSPTSAFDISNYIAQHLSHQLSSIQNLNTEHTATCGSLHLFYHSIEAIHLFFIMK